MLLTIFKNVSRVRDNGELVRNFDSTGQHHKRGNC